MKCPKHILSWWLWRALDRKFRIIYKKKGKRRGGSERGQGAMGPCESMWKNYQCWRRLNSWSLKCHCCGHSSRKLMKERSTDNSCCFNRSLPPHYWPDSYNQKKRILLPRKRVRARVRESSKQGIADIGRRSKKYQTKGTGQEIAEPRAMTTD